MVPVETGLPYFFRVKEIMCFSVDGNELEALGKTRIPRGLVQLVGRIGLVSQNS